VKESALPGSPLTSKLPTSKYRCSWDQQENSITNLIIPDDGLNSLLSSLKAGKFFGMKLSYLYSGKMIPLFDLLIAILSFLLLILCEYKEAKLTDHAVLSALLSCGSKLCVTIVVASLAKFITWDIGYWIPGWWSWLKLFRAAKETELNNPSQ
jgi:hypothetical protein